ncbi:MAG: hypothetical protein Q9167_005023 [Letrouitia subvulpina]
MHSEGELSLSNLLSGLHVSLHPETFVFTTFPSSFSPPSTLPQQMNFQEDEGLTVITTRQAVQQHGLKHTFPCRMITVKVHSSLEAVGFMAIMTKALAEKRVGVNPVSGFFHDHLFVPEGKEGEAMEVLEGLRNSELSG